MRADGEELDHGRVTQADAGRGVEVGLGNGDLLGHAAVRVHADDLECLAAIGLAFETGGAVIAREIGIDHHHVAGGERAAIGIEHDPGQLMTHDAGIFEKGVGALEDVIVGAADADMADGDANPAVLEGRGRHLDER